MGTKNISLKDEAYEALKRMQLKGESFSDTVIRLSKKFGNLLAYVENASTYNEKEAEAEIKNLETRRVQFAEGREY